MIHRQVSLGERIALNVMEIRFALSISRPAFGRMNRHQISVVNS